MQTPYAPVPDMSLGDLRSLTLSESAWQRLLEPLAVQLGTLLRNGGVLRHLDESASLFRDGRFIPVPAPVSKKPAAPRPERLSLLADLRYLEREGGSLVPSPRLRIRFTIRLLQQTGLEPELIRNWLRILADRHSLERCELIRYRYAALYRKSQPDRSKSLNGIWEPDPSIELPQLHEKLQECFSQDRPLLKQGRRANVLRTDLWGEEVILKQYHANPRPWRRRHEVSRARRSWIGGRTLELTTLHTSLPLGWLERRENGILQESFLISRPPPTWEDARSWMRRILPGLSPRERQHLRHRLRREVLAFYRNGVHHRDFKLGNLLVEEPEPLQPRFYVIDLEDLRPGRASFRTMVRNFCQLNGSLPRSVTRKERIAFARGFQTITPLVCHAWTLAVVEWKTRRRFQRELKRICGA